MTFTSQIFFKDVNHGCRAAVLKKSSLWLLPFFMTVATYCCYEKVCRTMRTSIASYLFKQRVLFFQSGVVSHILSFDLPFKSQGPKACFCFNPILRGVEE